MHRIPRNSEVSIISKTVASSSEFPVYFIVNKIKEVTTYTKLVLLTFSNF